MIIDSLIVPLVNIVLVRALELKKITVFSFVFAFADSMFLTVISICLQAIGSPASTDLLNYGLGPVVQILGILGLAAFGVFVLSALALAFTKLPKREDDL